MLALALALGAFACHDAGRSVAASRAASDASVAVTVVTDASTDASTTPDRDAGSPPTACRVTLPAGSLEVVSKPTKSYGDIGRVVLVTSGPRALVTTSLSYKLDCEHDGCYGSELFGAWLGGDRAPAWILLPSSATGISPSMTATSVVRRGELLALTQGHHGAAVMDPKQAPNELWLVGETGTPSVKGRSLSFTAETMASSADGSLVAAVGAEHSWTEVMTGSPTAEAVRVVAVADDGKLADQLVHRTPDAPNAGRVPHSPQAPSIATGESRAAVTYRVDDELWLAEVDRKTGRRLAPPRRVTRGDLGHVALAFEGDVLHAMWARRMGRKPYVLEHARWDKGLAADPVVEVVVERDESAIAPSVAFAGGSTWVFTWMEGDLSRRGRVLLGSSRAGLADAIAHAEVLSDRAINARDPKVAVAPGARSGWVVWSEFGAVRAGEPSDLGKRMALRYARVGGLSSCP